MFAKPNLWLVIAGLSGAMSVAAGAYGAHGLDDTPEYLRNSYNTAVQYQMWHSIALIGVAWLIQSKISQLTMLAGWAFVAGIILFSGSLYYFALTSQLLIQGAAPLGGICLIVGWIVIAYSGFKMNK